MKRKIGWRLIVLVLIGLVAAVLVVRAVVRFADAHVSYTDDAVDIEVVQPIAPPPSPAPGAN
jgi:hypothetical protein